MAQDIDKLDILYNAECPICSREIAAYRRASDRLGLPISYHTLDSNLRSDLNLTRDQAARRFHVLADGTLLDGLAAFRALWTTIPHLRWLAVLTNLPGLRPLAEFAYERIAAPILYTLHKRRERR